MIGNKTIASTLVWEYKTIGIALLMVTTANLVFIQTPSLCSLGTEH